MTFNKRGLSLIIHERINAFVWRNTIPREGLFMADQSITRAVSGKLPTGVDNVFVSIKQQRPYTDVYIAVEYLGKSHSGAGYSKVCGITDDHPPDEWSPETGIKYALGRAVVDALNLCEETALELDKIGDRKVEDDQRE